MEIEMGGGEARRPKDCLFPPEEFLYIEHNDSVQLDKHDNRETNQKE